MAAFFCLGDRDHHSTTPSKQEEPDHHHHHHHQDHHNHHHQQRNLLFYRSNDEISNKGFEIWPQQYHPHHHHHPHQLSNYMSFGLGSSTTSPTATTRTTATTRNYSFNINDVSTDDQPPAAAALGFTMSMMRPHGGAAAAAPGLGGSASTSSGAGGMNCQDCGNQAKKDCAHLRCRTCCKSRGFQCQTHVKSTWVPASKRRERQQQLAALQQLQSQQQQQEQHQFRVDNSKRQRDHSAANATMRNLPTATSGLELGGAFPPEVNSPAVFRCVRVSAMDDADEHFAYQTAVNIGGHVFKGILYDQGLDGHFTTTTTGGGGEGSSGHGRDDATQQLNLINTSATTATTTNNNNQSMSLLDPSLVYPTPINAFMAGTQFFPPPRS